MSAPLFIVASLVFVADGGAAPPPRKLALKDCLAIGLEKSLQLSDAEWQLRVAEARRSEARWSRWFPYMETNFVIAPMPEVRGTVLDGTPLCDTVAGVCTPVKTPANIDIYRGAWGTFKKIDFNLIFPIDAALKLSAVERIASRAAEAVANQLERTRRKVVYDVTRAYWAVKTARAVDELLEEGMDKIRSAKKTLEGHIAKKEKGYSTTDLYKLEAFSAEAEGRYAEGKKFAALAISGLKLAMGLKEDDALDVDEEELDAVKEVSLSEETVREMAVARRHDLRALAKAVEAKRAHVSLLKRQLAPDLFLAFNASFSHSNVADDQTNPWVNDPYNGYGFGVFAGLKWTLDIPQKLARIRQADGELGQLQSQYDLATRAIAVEAKQVYHELAEARAKLTANRKAKKSMRKWLISSVLNFETGLLETRELLEAIGAYFKAMATLLKSIHDFNVGAANLAFVTERDAG